MKKNLYTLSLFLFIFLQWKGIAQERQDNAWKALFTDYSLSNSSTLRLETHVRTRQFFDENDQYLLRPSISFKVGNNSAFTTGYTLISTNTPQHRTIENNLWQQFSFALPLKRSSYFGWIRLEQRWQTKNSETGYGARIRFRTGFRFPLTKSQTSFAPKLVVFNEVFLLLQDNFPYHFNQNWTFFGFQQKISKKMRVLTGFQRNTIAKGDSFLHKNIWSSLFFYTL
ncbi:MAG: DUF2490 domain-containing protein [Flavobacteriaceae bacterium]